MDPTTGSNPLAPPEKLGAPYFLGAKAQNPSDFADVFVRENLVGGFRDLRQGPENAFFSATFVPTWEVQFPICRKPKRVRGVSFRIHLPQPTGLLIRNDGVTGSSPVCGTSLIKELVPAPRRQAKF
jgi:hypothetical protein